MIQITIETDNAAFEGRSKLTEVARILRELARKLERDQELPLRLRDFNGNTVGEAAEVE